MVLLVCVSPTVHGELKNMFFGLSPPRSLSSLGLMLNAKCARLGDRFFDMSLYIDLTD